MSRKSALWVSLCVVLFVFALRLTSMAAPVAAPFAALVVDTANVPVETNMHDFMEGYFQGTYRHLKTAMAAEPKATDRAAWRAIKADALILSEGGNLLLARAPAKDGDKWTAFSTATRDAGAKFYQAAKKQDPEGSKTAYGEMLTQCNACHKHFNEGKNQLTP